MIFPWFRRKRLDDLSVAKLDLPSLKRLTQILVIDDDPAAFPVSLLQREGYKITYWSSIQSLSQMEAGEFDVIILDISGVAKNWSAEGDGLAILRLLKKSNPHQYVISFSGQKSVHELSDFWKLSDDQLKKPVTAEDCKLKLDEYMIEHVNAGHYWPRILSVLEATGAPQKTIARLESRIMDQVKEKDQSNHTIRRILSSVLTNEKVIDLAATLSLKIVTAYMGG